VLRSTLTMTSVLASFFTMLAIGSAPSAAATDGVPSALFSGYATGAHSTHIHHSHRARTIPTATKHGSAQAVHSPAPVPIELQNRIRPSACVRVQTFRVDTQGHPLISTGC
jgi:hypothetical protein